MSLEWPVAPLAGSDQSCLIPRTDTWKMLVVLPCINVGDVMLFDHLKYNKVVWTRTRVSIFLKVQTCRERKHDCLNRLAGNHNIICLQEILGRDEFLYAFQVPAPCFQLFGTFIPNNANAGALRSSLN